MNEKSRCLDEEWTREAELVGAYLMNSKLRRENINRVNKVTLMEDVGIYPRQECMLKEK